MIATTSSEAKAARLRALGAEAVINYRTHQEWGKEVSALTEGQGVDQVIEVGGPGTLPQSINAVRIGGHISLIGLLTGRSGDIPTVKLMAKQVRLQGVVVGSRHHQRDLVRAMNASDLRPVIDRTFPLDEIADAFRYQETGQHLGKIGLEW